VYEVNGYFEDETLENLVVLHRPPTLEDVFLRLTGRALQEE